MKADQVNLFNEYTELRAISPNCKRVEQLETLLVQMNRGLIYFVASRMPSIWQYQSEIKTVGMATLLKAVRTYDPNRGHFGEHAEWLLKSSEGLQSIQRFHACGPIKIPHNAFISYLAEKKKQAKNPESEFSDEYQAVNSAITNVSRFGEKNGDFLPLEETLEQETFTDSMVMVERIQTSKALHDTIDALDNRAKQVICLLYGLDENTDAMDLRSVGRILSISHEMVRKIRDKALCQIKKNMVPFSG